MAPVGRDVRSIDREQAMTIDSDPSSDRRAGILAVKLGALVTRRWGRDEGEHRSPGTFPGGATLTDRTRLWAYLEDDPAHRLGGLLALAQRAGVEEVHVVVDDPDAGGALARRATAFVTPIHVWRADGASLAPIEAVAAPPVSMPEEAASALRPILAESDLEIVVEDGTLVGEVYGLETARVVVDDDRGARVEAGVGRFDREAGAMMFADLAVVDSVARAADYVRRHRHPGAERHPLNQLVPERWLRSRLVAEPGAVGAAELVPVPSALPRRNLRERGVASAVGVDADGQSLLVTCSTGVDLDLVPSAADDRLLHAPGARLVLVVPARDVHAITTALARSLVDPAEIAAVEGDWRDGPLDVRIGAS